ncbi:MAG: hypothetical protein LBS94_01590, partial [Prevotellaceae bacterium]|jgi:hypothetical protein|nr:hypothetical protein [Prevotellaceae bacterium]
VYRAGVPLVGSIRIGRVAPFNHFVLHNTLVFWLLILSTSAFICAENFYIVSLKFITLKKLFIALKNLRIALKNLRITLKKVRLSLHFFCAGMSHSAAQR